MRPGRLWNKSLKALDRELTVALEAALAGGQILKQWAGRTKRIRFKGEINLVTRADTLSQRAIVRRLRASYPNDSILGEEGYSRMTDSARRWIIDPLDGTTNYAHSLPIYSVSVALQIDGFVVLGAVYNPNLEEVFFAIRGRGGYLGNRPIRVSKTRTVGKSLLATGFPYDIRVSRNNNLRHFSNFAVRAQAIRRGGSAALDLCYVACGRFDGFWELKLGPWDTAAGYLIASEAGARVTDFSGRPFNINMKEVVAANQLIHGEMLHILKTRDRH